MTRFLDKKQESSELLSHSNMTLMSENNIYSKLVSFFSPFQPMWLNEHHTEDVKIGFLKDTFPLLCIEREQINLKVVQTLGSEKVQVGLTFIFPVRLL